MKVYAVGMKEADRGYPQQRSCTLEFDGTSKGNPGQAGAGAVVRADDGSLVMITVLGLYFLFLVSCCTYITTLRLIDL